MTGKPKTVLELFEGHPERLVKNPYNSEETAEGHETYQDHPDVARWCLFSGIQFVYGDNWEGPYDRFCEAVGEENGGCTGFLIDNQRGANGEYDFMAIIAKLREVGI